MPAQVRERNSPSFFVHFYLLTNLNSCGIIGRALTVLALGFRQIAQFQKFFPQNFVHFAYCNFPVMCYNDDTERSDERWSFREFRILS